MTRSPQDLPALLAIARRHGGVVGDADLRACGFSTEAVARRIRAGLWQRVGGAVLVSEAIDLTPAMRHGSDRLHARQTSPSSGQRDLAAEEDLRWAWILRHTYGEEAVISGALALRRARWWLPVDDLIVITPHRVRRSVRVDEPASVHILRRRVDRVVAGPDGLRFTTALDAFCDVLITASRQRRHDLIDVALQRRHLDAVRFADHIEHRLGRGRRGAAILREALERISTGSRSEAEQRMRTLLARSGTGPWTPNLPLYDETGRIAAEIDFAHEGLRIAIEVDGRAHHTGRIAFERDRARQNILMLQGWLVLRFTWEQITRDPQGVINAVLAAVRQRQAA